MVGALQYLTMSRPDIAYVIYVVFEFMRIPRASHLYVVKHIFSYLQGIANHGLFFQANTCFNLMVALCDSYWVRCLEGGRSITRLAVFFGSNRISWCSKKQPTVFRSPTKILYHVTASTTNKIQWLWQLSS